VVFQTDHDEIELLKHQLWRHRNYVTGKRHKIFPFWAPPNQNFLATPLITHVILGNKLLLKYFTCKIWSFWNLIAKSCFLLLVFVVNSLQFFRFTFVILLLAGSLFRRAFTFVFSWWRQCPPSWSWRWGSKTL